MVDTSALTVICTAIPATLLALGTLITSMKNSVKADTAISKTDTAIGKADVVIRKTDEIHTLTNSTMTQVRSDLSNALTKIGEMERLIAALHAANLPRDIPGPAGAPGEVGPAGPVGQEGPPGPAGQSGSLWGKK
jgi:hypothetical protein